MPFIDSPIEHLLTDKAEELRAAAVIEERKAAGNITLVNQYRYAAMVIDNLKAHIEELVATVPTAAEIPPSNPSGTGTPEENGVDPQYEAFLADTTPPTEEI